MAVKRSCGDEPILGIALTAAAAMVAGAPEITLTWPQAVDEAAGEQDVTRYVIWRRPFGAPDWGDPFLSIPSGLANYTYQDQDIVSGDQFTYRLAAQDCTPSLSTTTQTALITVP
jgi:hypothetical protein